MTGALDPQLKAANISWFTTTTSSSSLICEVIDLSYCKERSEPLNLGNSSKTKTQTRHRTKQRSSVWGTRTEGVSKTSYHFVINTFIMKYLRFHGSDYEECLLLGYKTPVRTSQETHYVSATESSQLMLCKIWGVHNSDYEECLLLGYKTPVRTSQETHYVSATESSQLMLCKIWGLHNSDYEECRLLGYKTPVRTSQETHYISATESSQLMLCKIWGFHGSDNEEYCLLGCYDLWLL
jgi:hypothetical protein